MRSFTLQVRGLVEQDQASLVSSLVRLIRSDPRNLRAYCDLAKVYESDGQPGKAEFTLRRAIEIDPLYAATWNGLGILFSNLGDWGNSANAFERASALDSSNLASWVGYGMALIATQDLSRAVEVRDALLGRFPERSESHLIAGHISKVRGHVAAAAEHYRRALQIDPRQTEALYNLVDLSPPELADPLTASLEALRQDHSLSKRQSANVCFALARIYDRAGQIARAFSLYQEANAAAGAMMQELRTAYDPRQLEEDTDQIIEMFSADVYAQRLEPLDLDIKMIFIVGLPRSGTTLVEQILGGHSRVSTGGEPPFMQKCLAKLRVDRESLRRRGRIRLDEEADCRLLVQARELYLDGLFERELDGDYVIDKLPANFSAIGLIRLLFPDALIVHCTRDPIATCWSLYTAHFGIHLPYYTSLESLVHYYNKIYSRFMTHWKNAVGLDIIDVRYEELVVTPDGTVRELLKRCGLSFEEACLSVNRHEQPIYTASMQQVRQPIYVTSISSWRRFEGDLTQLVEGLRQKE